MMTARPMSEERGRSISDAEWESMTDQQWLQHRIDRCAAYGWTANKERYERIQTALLSTSAAERGMREALEKYRDDYCEGWCKENGGAGHFDDCGGCPAALALSGIEPGEDEQACGQGRSESTDTKGTSK